MRLDRQARGGLARRGQLQSPSWPHAV